MIHLRCIIEIAGFPKEHVEKTIKNVIETIKKEENFQIIKSEIEEVKEIEKMFSTFTEVELKVENFSDLVQLSYFYMPSSIEIISPDEFNSKSTEIADLFNDLVERIHKVDMTMKNLLAENQTLKQRLGSSQTQ